MELQFYNTPNKSLVFATGAEPSLAVWTRVKAMHAPWLVVIDREGKATGVLPAESLRNAMRHGAHGVVSQLPFKGAAVLPRSSRLSELLKAGGFDWVRTGHDEVGLQTLAVAGKTGGGGDA